MKRICVERNNKCNRKKNEQQEIKIANNNNLFHFHVYKITYSFQAILSCERKKKFFFRIKDKLLTLSSRCYFHFRSCSSVFDLEN